MKPERDLARILSIRALSWFVTSAARFQDSSCIKWLFKFREVTLLGRSSLLSLGERMRCGGVVVVVVVFVFVVIVFVLLKALVLDLSGDKVVEVSRPLFIEADEEADSGDAAAAVAVAAAAFPLEMTP